ncbi:MAG: MBOAT family protein [Crocinitomicaceae bacterium]|nr:MBOAT family protein [Crocinitomicaceae bacterium]
MLFDSLQFLIFLPLVIILYYLLPHKMRWVLLLVASYIFYGTWKAEFLILIAYSTIVDYVAARQMDRTELRIRKRIWLTISLLSNFGVLFIFKYFNFFIGRQDFFIDFVGQHPKVEWFTGVLEYGIPVGISFYTFQTVGYTIDVYRGKVKPEKNLGKFALFVSYFPQLVAGPIERYGHLRPQIFAHHKLNYESLSNGFRLILYGLFIKMVIADNIAPLIDPVYANPLAFDQATNILSVLLFSLQIYADFHGYSLIAIGVAKMMGVNLMDNFKAPYFAHSIQNFWSRWHISLSTWFRDYLYIPLGGNRMSYFRWVLNILIVFIVSGVWHGANFTFIIWGAIHGLLYLSEQIFTRHRKTEITGVRKAFGITKTFLLVNVAWLFFRSDTLSKAYLSLAKIIGFTPSAKTYQNIGHMENATSNQKVENVLNSSVTAQTELVFDPILIIPLLAFIVLELIIQKNRFDQVINKTSFTVRWLIYSCLIYFVMTMSGAEFYQFIYFQF